MALFATQSNGAVHMSLADSPRRSPVINHATVSPAKSVSPEHHTGESTHHMESFDSHVDLMGSPRQADFFDDDSDETELQNAGVQLVAADVRQPEPIPILDLANQPQRSMSSQQDGRRATYPASREGYQCLSTLSRLRDEQRFVDQASSSFAGSVDELLPSEHIHTPRFPKPCALTPTRTPRSSGAYVSSGEGQTLTDSGNKAEHILNAHVIAHEITLQALMRDEGALEHGLQLAPLDSGARQSLLPAALRANDPRSPRFPGAIPDRTRSNRKVRVAPPPIETSIRGSLPQELVRTPYPGTEERHREREDFGPQDSASKPRARKQVADSKLRLTIRRSNRNGVLRSTVLTIPASNEFSAVRVDQNGKKEQYFQAHDFDDTALFHGLRKCYAEMTGFTRFLNARSLAGISVSGPTSRAADARYGWLQPSLSARTVTSVAAADPLNAGQLLRYYRKPALGKSRYAFVHWAHRLAAVSPSRNAVLERHDSAKELPLTAEAASQEPAVGFEGLEFVVGWSVRRIALALAFVLMLSVAAALLWVFLGKSTAPGWHLDGGFRGAGDRVATGVLIGICVLLLGLSVVGGWLGISWVVM